MSSQKSDNSGEWVRESRFGRWFLGTETWNKYVQDVAINDFKTILGERKAEINTILDAGCGYGMAFPLLEQAFSPQIIYGIEIDKSFLPRATVMAESSQCSVFAEEGTAANLRFKDSSIDLVFCHQLLHHVSDQEQVLKEFYRVLVPGGLLLVSESCSPFVNSPVVGSLFRHPKQAQKKSHEYIDLVRSAGFEFGEKDIMSPYPWWSRLDFGLFERMGFSVNEHHENTEIVIVADKPL